MIKLEIPVLEFGKRLPGVDYPERLCSYAVIFDQHLHVAIIRLPQGYYLPGGGKNPDETFESALKREILEETGYSSRVICKIGIAGQYRQTSAAGTPYIKTGHFYLTSLGTKIQDPVETDHILEWHDHQTAARLLKHESQAWSIEYAVKLLRQSPAHKSGRGFNLSFQQVV